MNTYSKDGALFRTGVILAVLAIACSAGYLCLHFWRARDSVKPNTSKEQVVDFGKMLIGIEHKGVVSKPK